VSPSWVAFCRGCCMLVQRRALCARTLAAPVCVCVCVCVCVRVCVRVCVCITVRSCRSSRTHANSDTLPRTTATCTTFNEHQRLVEQ
jgi:hypothetical protein